MARYACVPGVSTEPVGHLWAAYSPASGETLLLNDESAAILEVLASGACDTAQVCAALASDSGLDAAALLDLVDGCWPRLIEAGLVRELHPAVAVAR